MSDRKTCRQCGAFVLIGDGDVCENCDAERARAERERIAEWATRQIAALDEGLWEVGL